MFWALLCPSKGAVIVCGLQACRPHTTTAYPQTNLQPTAL